MIKQDELEKLYFETFPEGLSPKEISDKLLTLKVSNVEELREMFCDELLYAITMGYTKYERANFGVDPMILLLCDNIKLLPKQKYHYFYAVRAFFEQNRNECVEQIKSALTQVFSASDRTIDEFTIVDWFFEPFKNAFPGFWIELSKIVSGLPATPGAADLCLLIGQFYDCNSGDEVIDLLGEFHRCHQGYSLPIELLGHTYYEKKMWKNAIAYFESVEDKNIFFRNTQLFFMMAYCYGQMKDHSLEETYYKKVLSEEPEHLDALNNLGYCLYAQKQYVEAKEIFEKCLALDDAYRYAVNNYLRVLIALGRNKDAKEFAGKKDNVSKDLLRKIEKLDNTNARVRKVEQEPEVKEAFDLPERRIDFGVKHQQFSSEKLLEDELTARIESGMEVFGLNLKMYRRKGVYGRQFIIPIGRLDLLCEDVDGNLYVIELKKDSGYDDAYKQTADYLDWFATSELAKGKHVYGIICLNSPDSVLLEKVHNDKRMRVFEYKISYTEL